MKDLFLAGVDEAGRGAFAGPVVAGAVILTKTQEEALLQMGLRDSKKMTALSRERLFLAMDRMGVVWSAKAASAELIDGTDILKSALWAMGKALLGLPLELIKGVLVDGDRKIPGISLAQRPIPHGDDLFPQISAASVVAKVLRDRVMAAYDKIYPGYGFASHKGYGTKAHKEAMERLGLCPIHRKTFRWRTQAW